MVNLATQSTRDDLIGWKKQQDIKALVKAYMTSHSIPATYYTLHQGMQYGSASTSVPCEYGIGPTLQMLNSQPTQWTNAPNWWKGDGIAANTGMLGSLPTLAEWSRVIAIEEKVMLICCQIKKEASPAASEYPIVVGYRQGGFYSHARIKYGSNGSIAANIHSDNQANVSITGPTLSSLPNEAINIFLLVDNTPTVKLARMWWGPTDGTTVLTESTSASLSTLNSISAVATGVTDPALYKHAIGGIYNKTTQGMESVSSRSIRRARTIKFDTAPLNIVDIIGGLNKANLLDCAELLTI